MPPGLMRLVQKAMFWLSTGLAWMASSTGSYMCDHLPQDAWLWVALNADRKAKPQVPY
jgi:hypothetical protein